MFRYEEQTKAERSPKARWHQHKDRTPLVTGKPLDFKNLFHKPCHWHLTSTIICTVDKCGQKDREEDWLDIWWDFRHWHQSQTLSLLLYVHVGLCPPQCIYGGQKITCRTQFSPFAVWALGRELRSSAVVARVYLLSCPAYHTQIFSPNNLSVFLTNMWTILYCCRYCYYCCYYYCCCYSDWAGHPIFAGGRMLIFVSCVLAQR